MNTHATRGQRTVGLYTWILSFLFISVTPATLTIKDELLACSVKFQVFAISVPCWRYRQAPRARGAAAPSVPCGRTGKRVPRWQRMRYDALWPPEGSVVQPQRAQALPHLRTNRSSSFLECSAEDTHTALPRETVVAPWVTHRVFAGPSTAVEGGLETRRGSGAWRIGRCTQGARWYLEWLQPRVPTPSFHFLPKEVTNHRIVRNIWIFKYWHLIKVKQANKQKATTALAPKNSSALQTRRLAADLRPSMIWNGGGEGLGVSGGWGPRTQQDWWGCKPERELEHLVLFQRSRPNVSGSIIWFRFSKRHTIPTFSIVHRPLLFSKGYTCDYLILKTTLSPGHCGYRSLWRRIWRPDPLRTCPEPHFQKEGERPRAVLSGIRHPGKEGWDRWAPAPTVLPRICLPQHPLTVTSPSQPLPGIW